MTAKTTANTNGRERRTESKRATPATVDRTLRWGSRLLAATGLLFVVHGLGTVYRGLQSTYEMGVTDLGGVTPAELSQTNPAVQSYIDHLAVNLGGLLVVAGIAMAALAWFGVRRGQRWALGTTVLIPVVFTAFSIPVHQTVEFHYHELVHLGPAGIGAPLLIVGAILAYRGLRNADRSETGDSR